jgi:hypothetical protein
MYTRVLRTFGLAAILLAAVTVGQADVINGDFESGGSGQFTTIGDSTSLWTDHIAIDGGWGAGALGSRDYGWERTEASAGNYAASFVAANAGPLLQMVTDNKATTGTLTMTFDVAVDDVAGDPDNEGHPGLNLYVFGWNSGDTPPESDSGNGELNTGDELNDLNDAVNLIAETEVESDGKYKIVENGSFVDGSLSADGTFQSVSVDLDLASGYDVIGVMFYGQTEYDEDVLMIDNVVVPEPATMAVLGIGGLGVLLRRRRA